MNAMVRLMALAAAAFCFDAAAAHEREPDGPPQAIQAATRGPDRDREIYGWQLMTIQEREAFRARLRSARTAQEQARMRLENHTAMQARARERGVTLRPAPEIPVEHARERERKGGTDGPDVR
jgi:hypothetical protein